MWGILPVRRSAVAPMVLPSAKKPVTTNLIPKSLISKGMKSVCEDGAG